MQITYELNGKKVTDEVEIDRPLLQYLREKGCYSVKCGCETSNCGLCTVLLDGRPVLSCTMLAVRIDGSQVVTLEGLQQEAAEFGRFLAQQGADQCGFCNPGFIMNVLAMEQELVRPDQDMIKEYLAGNLCRCTGYQGHLRAVEAYLNREKEVQHV